MKFQHSFCITFFKKFTFRISISDEMQLAAISKYFNGYRYVDNINDRHELTEIVCQESRQTPAENIQIENIERSSSKNNYLLSYKYFQGKAVFRCIREIIIETLKGQGYFLFHASGFSKQEKSILISGSSYSGKTSLMLHAIFKGLDYHANDKVISKFDESLSFASLPYGVGIRKSSLESLDYSRQEELKQKGYFYKHKPNRLYVDDFEFETLIQGSVKREFVAPKLFFPFISKSTNARISKISKLETESAIRSQIFGKSGELGIGEHIKINGTPEAYRIPVYENDYSRTLETIEGILKHETCSTAKLLIDQAL